MEIAVAPTMDCEPPRSDISEHAKTMSPSGPRDEEESRRSIEGFVEQSTQAGFTPTLFCHPEVATNQREYLLSLKDDGICLGLHLHPYKFDEKYDHDLGAYPPNRQRSILVEAVTVWESALGHRPRYFRAGKFSANDNTIRLLDELGFEGGSLSNVGRVLPESASVWAGAQPYPHFANEGFRQLSGDSDFVEVPVLGDVTRPIQETGEAGERAGFEWLYLQSDMYNHMSIVENLAARFVEEEPAYPTFVFDTHNDTDFRDADNSAPNNLERIFAKIAAAFKDTSHAPVAKTIGERVNDVRSSNR